MPKLSQETIAVIAVFVAVIGVGVTLGALILTTTSGLRDEIQAVRAEGRADREAIRAEGRAHREAFEERMTRQDARFEERMTRQDARFEERMARFEEQMARFEEQMARFEEHIIRLTEQQGALGGLVEGLRQRQPTAAGPSGPPPG